MYIYVGQVFLKGGMLFLDSVIFNGVMLLIDSQGGFIVEFDYKENELFVVDGLMLMCCLLYVKCQQDVLMMVGKVCCEVVGLDVLLELL